MNVSHPKVAVLGAGPHGHQISTFVPRLAGLYDDALPDYEPVAAGADSYPWLVGAAWPKVRRHIAESVADAKFECAYGTGTIFYPGAKFGTDVRWGKHVHVQFNAVVSHGCTLGDYVTICPSAVLSGEVTVEDDVFIGANATVIHGGIRIGRGAIIGAGAVVIEDVAPNEVVAGVPAEFKRFVE